MSCPVTRKPRARRRWALLGPALLLTALPATADSLNNPGVLTIAAADIAQFNSVTAASTYRRQLIGFFVDDQERSGLFTLTDGTAFLLPLQQVLDDIGASLEERDGQAWIATPSGDTQLSEGALHTVDGKLMIKMQALSDDLHLQAQFDQSTYALRISLPWDPKKSGQRSAPERTPQFKPPAASLRNMRADFTYLHNDEINDLFGEYFLAGNLSAGTWQIRVEQDADEEFTPFDYYWHRSFEKAQVLLGNSTFSMHPLLPSIEQTGAQVLYSNKGFKSTSSRVLTSADGAREVGSGTRRITGNGEPGSIAELRINGGVVARTRVRLDGTFEFTDIEVSTRGRSEIKVLLLDRASGVLIETLDYSRRGGIGLLDDGQHSVFVAVGDEGNPLEEDNNSRGTATAAQWRQGITENLTVEAAYQDNGEMGTGLVGASLAFAEHWFGSLAYAEGEDIDALEFTLDGGRDRWESDFTASEFWVDDNTQRRHQWVRYGNYRHFTTERLTLGLAGRDARTTFEDERFLLPTISWNDGDRLWASAWPNINGNYRVDSRFNATRRDSFRYTYEEDNHLLDFRHRTDNSMEYYANARDGDERDFRAEAGFIYYSINPLYERTQFGLVGSDNTVGFIAQWDARLLPGVYSRLQLSDNAFGDNEFEFDDGFTVQWDVSFDFAVSRGRVVAGDTQAGRADSAALTGAITVNGKKVTSALGIDRIVVVVDGVSHTATVQGGQFYVDGLLPGVRRVSLESRHLPLEMVPADDQVYWVELARAAATDVPFDLEVRYAIAGKVTDASGTMQPQRSLQLRDSDNTVIANLTSNQFGFYRADNLKPGQYRISVTDNGEEIAGRDILVSDAFLFGQDIVLP